MRGLYGDFTLVHKV